MVRKTGFDYVEFGSWAQHDIKKIKSLLEENRLQLGCFSGDKDYNLIDPAHCKEFLEYFKRSVEAAHFLDCKNLVIHSNALGEEGRMCTDGNDLNDRTKIACATKNLLEIIYQELHLDYPLNEERGIPLKVVMEGYRSAQKKAKKLYGVEIVYIAGLDRTLSSERCLSFVKALRPYLDMVAGLGIDGLIFFLGHITDPPCHSVRSKLPRADPGTWGGRC